MSYLHQFCCGVEEIWRHFVTFESGSIECFRVLGQKRNKRLDYILIFFKSSSPGVMTVPGLAHLYINTVI